MKTLYDWYNQAIWFGPSTQKLSMPFGDRLMVLSAVAVATKNMACWLINSRCLSEMLAERVPIIISSASGFFAECSRALAPVPQFRIWFCNGFLHIKKISGILIV